MKITFANKINTKRNKLGCVDEKYMANKYNCTTCIYAKVSPVDKPCNRCSREHWEQQNDPRNYYVFCKNMISQLYYGTWKKGIGW